MKTREKNIILIGLLALTLIGGCSNEKPSAQAQNAAPQQTETSQKTEKAQKTDQQPGTLALTYTYKPKSGAWSNQMAVWIEDAEGKVVRTLMATRFTAQGGYQIREMSIPTWVKRSNLAQMDSKDVDALTSATPQGGTHTLIWDGKDAKGQPVPDGSYKIFMEATLYKYSDELFTGSFTKGSQNQNVTMEATLTQEPEHKENRDMISDVSAVYKGTAK
jgi:hypothetical protein